MKHILILALTAVLAQAPAPSVKAPASTPDKPAPVETEVDKLKKENEALREQLIDKHHLIGELQQQLGTCNMSLAETTKALVGKK